MNWEFEEELFLLELFENTRNCSAKEKDIKIQELSNLLIERATLLGMHTDETFRNFIGIRMKLLNIEYIASNGEYGLENYSALDLKVYKLFSESYDKFNESLKNAKGKIESLRKEKNSIVLSEDKQPEEAVDKNHDYLDEEETAFYTIYDIPIETISDAELSPNQFSVRTYNCLRRGNVNTIGQLLRTSFKHLSSIKNMGAKSIDEVVSFIKTGISFEENIEVNDEEVPQYIKDRWQQIIENDFSFISELDESNDLEIIEKYKEAVSVVDNELAMTCVLYPHSVIPVIKALNSFASKEIVIDSRRKKIQKQIAQIPQIRQNADFLRLFTVCEKEYSTSKELKQALPFEGVKVYQCTKLKSLDNDQLYAKILGFLRWCHYDINKAIDEYFNSNILNKGKIITVLEGRAKGLTLEAVGNQIGVTRERVRQIEAKAKRKFEKWQYYENTIPKIAIELETDILNPSDLEAFFGTNTLIALYLLREIHSSGFNYDRNLDVFSVSDNDIFSIIQEHIDDLPNVFSAEKLEQYISNAVEDGIEPELFISAINDSYKLSGNTYHRYKLSRSEMCNLVLKKYYPNGIHIYDEQEMDGFVSLLEKEFGEQDFSDSKRAVVARVGDVGILCGRGVYKPKQEKYISKDLLNKIVEYIENTNQAVFMTNSIFHLFSDELINEGVDNKYYLQGVLHELLKDKYVFRRDYISKDESVTSYSTEIIRYIKSSQYPVLKDKIYEKFPGITEIVINLAVQDKNIVNYFGQYFHVSNFNLQSGDRIDLSKIINKCLEVNDCVHIKDVFEIVKRNNQGFLKRLFIEYPYHLFSVLEYLLKGRYIFQRPYIAKLGTRINKAEDVLEEFVKAEDIIDVDDLLDLTKELHYPVNSILDLINSYNETCLLISAKEIAKISYIGVSKDKCEEIENLIKDEVNNVVRIRDLSSIYKLNNVNVAWTDWLIYSVINKWSEKYDVGTTSNQFKLALPLIAPKGKMEKNKIEWTNSKQTDFKIKIDDLDDLENLEIDFSSEDF